MMFLREKLTRSLSLGKESSDESAPQCNSLSEEDMLKKLRLYQKRTYLNQELSRRRSIERFYGHHLFTDDLTRERAHSAPHSPVSSTHFLMHDKNANHSLIGVENFGKISPNNIDSHDSSDDNEAPYLTKKGFRVTIQRTNSTQSDDYVIRGGRKKPNLMKRLTKQLTLKNQTDH